MGKHKYSGAKVAIKVIDKANSARVFGQFNHADREVKLMEECSDGSAHNILEIIESFEDDTSQFVVTKFMPAGYLLNYLVKQPTQPLSEDHARKIIIQIGICIESLHAKNIVHRDIKVENILMSDFSQDAKVRIADLGSAVKLQSANDTSTFKIGTPGYTAPEILSGLPYSFSCDIWSLGCLLHVLLTASPPFWDDDRKQRDRMVCHQPLDLEGNAYT